MIYFIIPAVPGDVHPCLTGREGQLFRLLSINRPRTEKSGFVYG